MKVSQAIAHWCKEIETPFVAGIPGNGILQLIDRLVTETDIPFVLTRHEQGASMMAYSYAFQTGRPAVAVGLKAPGSTNLGIGVMGAFVESLPMIVLTAQVSDRHLGLEAFEEIDLQRFFAPITKWSVQVTNPSRVMSTLNEAYRRTMTGRPAPVHVAIPYSLMEEEIGAYVSTSLPRNAPVDSESLDDIVRLLDSSRRPLVIAGGGIRPASAQDVISIAESVGAPIVGSWLRKPVPDATPNYVGMAGIGGSPAAREAIEQADVVLVFGCRFSEQMTEHYKMAFGRDAKVVHVDIDPSVIGRVFPAHLAVEADLRGFLPALRAAIERRGEATATDERRQWLAELREKQQGYRRELDGYERDDAKPQGRFVVEELRGLLDSDARLVLDSGNYLHWAEQYFPVEKPGLFHYPTSGAMGFGVPGAIGAKIANPNSFVCALVGDGGFAMTMGELETAKRIGTPILVVIINNSTLGHIRMRQEVLFEGRCVGVDFGTSHFSEVARAFELHGVEVTKPQDVRSALSEAIEVVRQGQTAVVDVHVSNELAAGPLNPWWTASSVR